jgi:flagellar basal body-associated protein FliL
MPINKTIPPKKKVASDRFAIIAASVVLLFFAGVALYIYLSRVAERNISNSTYAELQQNIVNDQGMVARLSVSVQVSKDDDEWLAENKAALNEQFRKELTSLDLETLRTKEGLQELQDELTRKLNLVFKTDKIQAVMVTELLLQDQRND